MPSSGGSSSSGSSGPYTPADHKQSLRYGKYGLLNTYDIKSGLFVLPVAEEPPTDPEELKNWSPVVVVRAHSDYRMRHVAFDAEKSDSPPVIPSAVDSGAFTFIEGSLNLPFPQFGTNPASHVWSATGVYSYVETSGKATPDAGYVIGSLPFMTVSQYDNYMLYGEPVANTGGAVDEAGGDVRVGNVLQNSVDFSTGLYRYDSVSYFPSVFLSEGMVNGQIG